MNLVSAVDVGAGFHQFNDDLCVTLRGRSVQTCTLKLNTQRCECRQTSAAGPSEPTTFVLLQSKQQFFEFPVQVTSWLPSLFGGNSLNVLFIRCFKEFGNRTESNGL